LQSDPETARIPVLLLSCVVAAGRRAQRCEWRGAVHHMVKPFSPDALLRSVQSLLRVHPTPVDPNTGHDLGRSYQW
jgi:response regulator RpfG family c-di-GMP phosphodiesterase